MDNTQDIVVKGQALKLVSEDTYQGIIDDIDFYITDDKTRFIVDIFDSTCNNDDEAHLSSFEAESLEQAVELAVNYQA